MIEQMVEELKGKLVVEFEQEVARILDAFSDVTIADFNIKTIEKRLCKKVFDEIAEKYKAKEPRWIPVKYHEITDKEREENCVSDNIVYWLDCKSPEDGEEILIVWKWRDDYITEHDTCYVDDGYYLDSGLDWREVVAWMPLPEYKEGDRVDER